MASPTPFALQWDSKTRETAKNLCRPSPCPQLQSIAPVAAGRNLTKTRLGRQKRTNWGRRRTFLHRCSASAQRTQETCRVDQDKISMSLRLHFPCLSELKVN